MKIINQLLVIVVAAFLDITLNGLMGRLVCLATPFFFAYHVSFFSSRILMLVAAFFVVMQAQLYSILSPFFYCAILVMLFSARFFNKLLREEPWVRWLLTIAYVIILVIFLPIIL